MNPLRSTEHEGTADTAHLNAILKTVRTRTGVDFACYRAPMVHRRVLNRMTSLGVKTFEHYRELLDRSDWESQQLVERVTIKVSRFYRHAPTFDRLRTEVLPQLAAARAGRPLRIWSVGCGWGEEPYTLAMLLVEAGIPGVIEASDIDPIALTTAQAAEYPASELEELPSTLAARYLEPSPPGSRHPIRVSRTIRSRVRFSRYDIIGDASPPGEGRFDLICCRNVLIYLQRETQQRVVERLRGFIEGAGVLCLGEAEWPPHSVEITVRALSPKTRLFQALDGALRG
jgi:chemotaxis methyl-accepting protein methylase